jgi:hypothetical protein
MLMARVDVLLVARMAGTPVEMIERVYDHFRDQPYQEAHTRLDRERTNVGIVMGDASGIFVAETDPRNCGNETMALGRAYARRIGLPVATARLRPRERREATGKIAKTAASG